MLKLNLTVLLLVLLPCVVIPGDPTAVSVVFGGDIILGRGVEAALLEDKFQDPFDTIRELVQADAFFCNLENPATVISAPVSKKYVFKMNPNRLGLLNLARMNVFNLVNNHILDQGKTGLLDTLANLRKHQYKSISPLEGRDVFIIDTRNIKIGIISFAPIETGYSDSTLTGTILRFPGVTEMRRKIRKLKQQVDYAVVSFHWGQERSSDVTRFQRYLAYLAVEAGADVIIGHGPHVLQNVERYRGAFIAYSLGNFLFDQNSLAGRLTVLLKIEFRKSGFSGISILPMINDGMKLRLAEDTERKQIFKMIGQRLFSPEGSTPWRAFKSIN